MKLPPTPRPPGALAELKLLIMSQQEVAAALFRRGERQQARNARAALLQLLNQLDFMESDCETWAGGAGRSTLEQASIWLTGSVGRVSRPSADEHAQTFKCCPPTALVPIMGSQRGK